MLSIIGLGLKDAKSISVSGLERVKEANKIYLETYTSKLVDCSIEDLEKFYGKKIIRANRDVVEKQAEETILKDSLTEKVCFLVIGDSFSATTHMDILERAKEMKIEVEIIPNTSVLTAIGIVGLELYKFGKITSIPFDNENVETPMRVYDVNKKEGMHTLFLLDLRPDENRYMQCKEASEFLIRNGLDENTKVICCAELGGNNQRIVMCKAKDVENVDLSPQCLIIPGNLHFMEEEIIEKWKN